MEILFRNSLKYKDGSGSYILKNNTLKILFRGSVLKFNALSQLDKSEFGDPEL